MAQERFGRLLAAGFAALALAAAGEEVGAPGSPLRVGAAGRRPAGAALDYGATNTFTINVAITRSGAGATNHTGVFAARVINQNASGVTIA